ncbi:MAG: PDZ domain-containing protein, partial [Flavobacteriaceae bacterium]|nr:PDZ domain-containing protein [Flavobacteriaceae bacterium]
MALQTAIGTLSPAVHQLQSEVLDLKEGASSAQRALEGLGRLLDAALVDKLAPLASAFAAMCRVLGFDEGWLLHRGARISREECTAFMRSLPWMGVAAAIHVSPPRHQQSTLRPSVPTPASSSSSGTDAKPAGVTLRDLARGSEGGREVSGVSQQDGNDESACKRIGLDVAPPSASSARRRVGVVAEAGAQVTKVWPASRAETAGFRVRDLILRVDQVDVRSAEHFEAVLRDIVTSTSSRSADGSPLRARSRSPQR